MLASACTTMTMLVQNDNSPTPKRREVMKILVQACKQASQQTRMRCVRTHARYVVRHQGIRQAPTLFLQEQIKDIIIIIECLQ
jgi:hypothetical protein